MNELNSLKTTTFRIDWDVVRLVLRLHIHPKLCMRHIKVSIRQTIYWLTVLTVSSLFPTIVTYILIYTFRVEMWF